MKKEKEYGQMKIVSLDGSTVYKHSLHLFGLSGLTVLKNGKVDVRLEGIDAELVVYEPTGQTDSPIFEGVEFCTPDPLESYPCFDTYYETALTY